MILIVDNEGNISQRRGEPTQEELQAIDDGDLNIFKYDHVRVTFLQCEVAPQEPEKESAEEGSKAPDVKVNYDFEWVSV